MKRNELKSSAKSMKIGFKSVLSIVFFVFMAVFATAQRGLALPMQNTTEESFQQTEDAFNEWSNLYSKVLFRDASTPNITFGFRLTPGSENPIVPVSDFTKDNSTLVLLHNPCSTEMCHWVKLAKYRSHYYIYSIHRIRI